MYVLAMPEPGGAPLQLKLLGEPLVAFRDGDGVARDPVGEPQPPGSQPHLGGRLLAGRVQHPGVGARDPAGDLEQQRRLADPGLAADQEEGPGNDPAA